jgi:hypothetical protein
MHLVRVLSLRVLGLAAAHTSARPALLPTPPQMTKGLKEINSKSVK